LFREKGFYGTLLSLSLGDQPGLRIEIKCCPCIGMPHEFLDDFDVLTIRNQKHRVCVPEGMPAYFLANTGPDCMIEEHAKDVADLRFGGVSQGTSICSF
jgi:hypothetical protein